MAAARTKGVEEAADVRGDVAEGIWLSGIERCRRQFHRYIRESCECGALSDKRRHRRTFQRLRRNAHVVDDEGELRVALGDAPEERGLALAKKHDRDLGLLGRWPKPV